MPTFAPYQGLQIDNRPVQAQFMDANPISEGFANLASSVISAGPEAARIRMAMEQRDKEGAQKRDALELQKLWHQQGIDERTADREMRRIFQDAQIANMGRDDARQQQTVDIKNAYEYGVAPNVQAPLRMTPEQQALFAAKSRGEADRKDKNWFDTMKMFGVGKPDRPDKWQLKEQKDELGKVVARYWVNPFTLEVRPFEQPQVNTQPAEMPSAESVTPEPVDNSPSFWSMRRSGAPGQWTMGDVMSGRWIAPDTLGLNDKAPEQFNVGGSVTNDTSVNTQSQPPQSVTQPNNDGWLSGMMKYFTKSPEQIRDEQSAKNADSFLRQYQFGTPPNQAPQSLSAAGMNNKEPSLEDKIFMFTQRGGFNLDAPPENRSVFFNKILGNDPAARNEAIMSLPTKMDKLKAIEALQSMGYQ